MLEVLSSLELLSPPWLELWELLSSLFDAWGCWLGVTWFGALEHVADWGTGGVTVGLLVML